MGKWFLVMFFLSGNAQPTHLEMPSKEACETAGDSWLKTQATATVPRGYVCLLAQERNRR